ncbi:hypothetical protein POMI540_1105 [Schizosaccharomyces pombe]
MSDKECTVFVLDLGKDMGTCHHGRSHSDLEWTLSYFHDELSHKFLANRKTDVVGIVGYKCDDTKNDLAEQEAYWNISVLYPIQTALFSKLQSVSQTLKPSNTMQGDLISAIVVSFDLMARHCKKNKWKKKMIVLTAARGIIDFSDYIGIAEQLLQHDVFLGVYGVDFDQEDINYSEPLKESQKKENEVRIQEFVESCHGQYCTFQQIYNNIGKPWVRKVRPVAIFRGTFSIGNRDSKDTSISIQVERYPRTRLTKPPTSSAFYENDMSKNYECLNIENSNVENKSMESDAVSTVRSYMVRDPKTNDSFEVKREDLESGYSYGRTIVPISRSDEDVLALDTIPGYEILGFIPKSSLPIYYTISDTNIIVPKDDFESKLNFSAFVQSLEREHRYALARFVSKDKGVPVLLVLMPYVEFKRHYLVDIQLPFAEDVRPYSFSEFEKLSNEEDMRQIDFAVSNYIDNMDLDSFDCGFNPPFEPENTFSMIPHRLQQAISYYANSPEGDLPQPNIYLTRYTNPPKSLLDNCILDLKLIKEKLTVNVPVKPKYSSQETAFDTGAPISEEQIEELLNSGLDEQEGEKLLVLHVSEKDPVGTFTEVLKNPFGLEDALTEMEKVIKNLIDKSKYDLALQSLQSLRLHSILEDEVERFNEYLTRLKKDVMQNNKPKENELINKIRSSGLDIILHDELTRHDNFNNI